jgi:hypothetical protein
VPRADSRSFILPNPDGVAEALQTLTNVVSGKFDDSRYVFSHDPTRSNFSDQARKFRPEIPVVVPRFPLTCHAEGQLLAWKSSVYDINSFPAVPMPNHLLSREIADIFVNRHVWPMPSQNVTAERIAFAHGGRHYPGHFSRQIKATGVQMPENNDKAVIVSGILDHLAVRFVLRAVH